MFNKFRTFDSSIKWKVKCNQNKFEFLCQIKQNWIHFVSSSNARFKWFKKKTIVYEIFHFFNSWHNLIENIPNSSDSCHRNQKEIKKRTAATATAAPNIKIFSFAKCFDIFVQRFLCCISLFFFIIIIKFWHRMMKIVIALALLNIIHVALVFLCRNHWIS